VDYASPYFRTLTEEKNGTGSLGGCMAHYPMTQLKKIVQLS